MESYERDVLRKYPSAALQRDEAFCAAVAQIQGELLVIHPFREGNARTIKLMTDILAEQTGRPFLVYDRSERGQDEYIAAAKAAFKKEYGQMEAILRSALERAQKTE